VTLGDETQPSPDLSASRCHSNEYRTAIVRVLIPGNQAFGFELADLPARCRRIHFGESRQLADLNPVLFLDPSQQLESGLGDHDPSRSRPALMHFPTGIETK
jgi:hypothetical protein